MSTCPLCRVINVKSLYSCPSRIVDNIGANLRPPDPRRSPNIAHFRMRRRQRAEQLNITKDRYANAHRIRKYSCPCTNCHGGGRQVLCSTIRRHLRVVGRDLLISRAILVIIRPQMIPIVNFINLL